MCRPLVWSFPYIAIDPRYESGVVFVGCRHSRQPHIIVETLPVALQIAQGEEFIELFTNCIEQLTHLRRTKLDWFLEFTVYLYDSMQFLHAFPLMNEVGSLSFLMTLIWSILRMAALFHATRKVMHDKEESVCSWRVFWSFLRWENSSQTANDGHNEDLVYFIFKPSGPINV